MKVLNFAFATSFPGLRAFSTLRGANLGLNTEAPKEEVLAARRTLWKDLGLPLERSVFMRQVHADRVVEVGGAQGGRGSLDLEDAIPDCDLMVTRDRGLLLCVGHADCLALLLLDPHSGSLAVGHMGWRGASLGVARTLVQAMGRPPQGLWAGLSVCLGPCHLELSEREYGLFQGQSCAGSLKVGHFMLDLRDCARSQLLDAGLEPGHIESQSDCTACHPQAYYSYRAESGNTGRMMSCIGWMP